MERVWSEGRKNVLVVDDKLENLDTAVEQLGTEYNLFTAQSFSEARLLLENEKIDIVMTDVFMPGEAEGQGSGEKYIGASQPVGLVVALFALKINIQQIYIVSDTNHHSHPVAWALDSIVGGERIKSFCGYECPMIKKEEDIYVKNWSEVLK